MSLRFDGLRTILGNVVVTVPEVDAPAAEKAPDADPETPPLPAIAAVADEPSTPAADLELQSTAPAADDFPDLSELDRGLYAADGTPIDRAPRDRHAPTFTSRPASAKTARLEDHDAFALDETVFAAPAMSPEERRRSAPAAPASPSGARRENRTGTEDDHDASERRVSAWAAVAVMAFGLFLGATAAMAVFHDHVSHIIAAWEGPPVPTHVRPQ